MLPDDLFGWAAAQDRAAVVDLATAQLNLPRYRDRPTKGWRAELRLRRRLGLEPPCAVFRIEEGPQGATWYRPPAGDNGVPWLLRRA